MMPPMSRGWSVFLAKILLVRVAVASAAVPGLLEVGRGVWPDANGVPPATTRTSTRLTLSPTEPSSDPADATRSASAPATTQPQDGGEPSLDELRRQLRARLVSELADLPRIPPLPLSEVGVIRAEADGLSVVTRLRETPGDVVFEGQATSDATLAPLVRLAVIGKPSTELGAPVFFRLTVHRFTDPDTLYAQVGLFANRDIGQFQLTYDAEGPAGHYSVQLIQSPRIAGQLTSSPDEMLTLLVRRIDAEQGEATLNFRGTAADFASLRRKFPVETNLHVRPIFELLGQLAPLFTADERAAWQVLGVAPRLTDAERIELHRILDGLEADRFADRQRARRELRDLGQRGALIVRGLDRRQLTPNQNAEIDAFLAAYSPLSEEEVRRLGNSPEFLLDCLELDIPELRAAAWERLRQLEGWQGDWGFDPFAGVESRAAQVVRLRQHLTRLAR